MLTLNMLNLNIREKYMLNLKIPGHNQVTFGSQSLRVFGRKVWNSLPYHIKSSGNLESFKMISKNWSCTRCSYEVCNAPERERQRLPLKGESGTAETSRMHHFGMVLNYHKVLRRGCRSSYKSCVWPLYSNFVQFLIPCFLYRTHLQLGFLIFRQQQ